MSFLRKLFGNQDEPNREEEWIRRFDKHARDRSYESERIANGLPPMPFAKDMAEMTSIGFELDWLEQNYVPGYGRGRFVHRDMCDAYLVFCWQFCRFGRYEIAKTALEHAKQWGGARVEPIDVPVKIGGPTSERGMEWLPYLPYASCKQCCVAVRCSEIGKRTTMW